MNPQLLLAKDFREMVTELEHLQGIDGDEYQNDMPVYNQQAVS